MDKKCKCLLAGAPEWVMTYGDMMSLLLVFFIMLVALSEIKKDQFRVIRDNIKTSFGMRVGGGGILPVSEQPNQSLIEMLEAMRLQQQKRREAAEADDPGIEGKQIAVTRVREDMYAVGGRITFEPGSADLSERAKKDLSRIAGQIRGYNNKIELRGHAALMELADGSSIEDLWTLSVARALAVMAYLTNHELGIRPERIRVVGNADHEPLARKVFTMEQHVTNRRVEILVSEALVAQFTRPEGPDANR